MAGKTKKQKAERYRDIRNAKAFHNFHIGERFEAGIVLTGTEVKSIRAGKAQITDAFARIDKGQVFLFHAHIDEYTFANYQNHKPRRPRKLLLHDREIRKIQAQIEQGGKTLVPLRMYFKQALVKVELAVATGKKLHDKRQTLKERDDRREAERALRSMAR